MYAKLAFRNVRRQASSYLVYFVTVAFTVALMFAVNTVMFSPDLGSLISDVSTLTGMLLFLTVLVVLVVGFVICYATSFMLKKRKKEFGTYLIFGMERKHILRIFVLENLIMGALSLAAGILLGLLLYQLFMLIITGIMGGAYALNGGYTLKGLLLTVAFVAGIFCVATLGSLLYLKRTKIYDLLRSERYNEKSLVNKPVVAYIVTALSAALVVGACIVVILLLGQLADGQENDSAMSVIMLGFVALAAGIFGLHVGGAKIASDFVNRSKRLKFKGTNGFLLRQMSSKVSTDAVSMGFIAILISFAVVFSNLSFTMNMGNADYIDTAAPFDISVSVHSSQTDFSALADRLAPYGIRQESRHSFYDTGREDVKKVFKTFAPFYENSDTDTDLAMRLSDANRLRQMRGEQDYRLGEEEFLIVTTDRKYAEQFEGRNLTLQFGGKSYLQAGAVVGYPGLWGLGDDYVLVLPDSAPLSRVKFSVYAAMLESQPPQGVRLDILRESQFEVPEDSKFGWQIGFRQDYLDSTHSSAAVFVTGALYIGVVFMFISMAILALKQLSGAAENKRRYDILYKLGVDKRGIDKLIFRQILTFFFLPVLIPFLLTVPTVIAMEFLFYSLLGGFSLSLVWIGLGVLGVYLAVYVCYFIATYYSFKAAMRRE